MTISAKSSDRWQKRGSMRNGTLYPRRKSEPGISGNGSGLLPTLTASQGGYNRSVGSDKIRPSLETMARNGLLPTLRATDGEKGGPNQRGSKGDPTVSSVVGGTLNPEWAEWYMGWPIGATALEPLGTGRFREWLRKHGID
jgi:hypothetical protein